MITTFLKLPRAKKQLIVLVVDSFLVILSVFLSFSLRLGQFYSPTIDIFFTIIFSPLIAVPIFSFFGLYKSVFRFIGLNSITRVFNASVAYSFIWGIAAYLLSDYGIPRSVVVINLILIFFTITSTRLFARFILLDERSSNERINVLVYGAGSAGRQLVNALEFSDKYKTHGFIDDNKDLVGNLIGGKKVFSLELIEKIISTLNITEILIAIPSATIETRNKIFESLSHLGIRIKALPGVSEIADGKVNYFDLKDISIEDLLGRDLILPKDDLLKKDIENKVVMITGAGGSIGSELSRQILSLGAEKIILYEHNESALYMINKELNNPKVFPIIGSITDIDRLKKVCSKFKVETIYHSAAYKHVPMVESNVYSGVYNNIFGTLNCVEVAINFNVKSFILISTDKAVRPTNIMGATKRISELILQSKAVSNKKTKFSMVRFGNVLNSSGSVIPLFKEQIKKGGPVTVTHKDITRYFMTIPEAVELVIQAGAIAKSGEVCILDMGKPVNIYQLAEKMIRLSGFFPRGNQKKDGIEVQVTGLRPGEKLFEELLIGARSLKTEHEMIFKEKENPIDWSLLKKELDELRKALKNNDINLIKKNIQRIVPDYTPEKEIFDSTLQ